MTNNSHENLKSTTLSSYLKENFHAKSFDKKGRSCMWSCFHKANNKKRTTKTSKVSFCVVGVQVRNAQTKHVSESVDVFELFFLTEGINGKQFVQN